MHGQISIFDLTMRTYKIDKPVRLIELFAGIGSQAMALRDLGADFEHYRVVESDKYAVASYNAIHGTDFETTDIRKISGQDLGITDTGNYCYIMTYSFPCQDLSTAGRQRGMKKGSGTRSGLLWEVERLLNECRELPQVLLMENVPQVHSKANMPDFRKWIDFLTDKGYSNYWQDLNAKDYGVAQNRERCFMVSILGEWNYRFPQPVQLRRKIRDYLEDEADEKYYIDSEKAQKLIRQLVKNGSLRDDGDYEMGGSFNQRGKVHGGESICRTVLGSGHAGNEPKVLCCADMSVNSPHERTVGNCITAKDYGISNQRSLGNAVVELEREVLGSIYYKASEDFMRGLYHEARTVKAEQHDLAVVELDERRQQQMIVRSVGRNPENTSDRAAGSLTEQRLEPNSQGICNTLTSVQKDNMVLEKCSKYRIRKLTPLECWRLMGFSDEDFRRAEKVNSNTQLYRQAGNSIVKNVLVAIFSQMIN